MCGETYNEGLTPSTISSLTTLRSPAQGHFLGDLEEMVMLFIFGSRTNGYLFQKTDAATPLHRLRGPLGF